MTKKNIRAEKKKTKKSEKANKQDVVRMLIPLISIIIVIYIIYKIINLIVLPTDMIMIENGVVSHEETAVGYVIRDEKIAEISSEDNDIIQIKAEGEKVAKGSQIFRYATKSEDELNTRIDELNVKIQEAMLGQTEPFPSDIKAIERQIETKIDGLKSKNDIQEIAELKKDINTYITKKSKIAGELSPAGSYINELIKEREKYQEELDLNSEYAIAPIAGVVSYRVDELEEILTPNNLKSLTKEKLEELNLQTGQIVTTSNEKGKIINNYECYIATILETVQIEEVKLDKEVTLRLSTQDEVKAKVLHVEKQDDNCVLVVFKINNCVEKLIDYRKISFDVIWWKYEGLKVPKSAIYYNNGLSYVVRNRAGYQDTVLVEVLKENENYCIVGNYNNEDLVSLGFDTQEINNMRKISIYDQILVNPNIN